MKVIADFHIHGPYSRATSERMCITEITRFAKIKGLNVVGTESARARAQYATFPRLSVYNKNFTMFMVH